MGPLLMGGTRVIMLEFALIFFSLDAEKKDKSHHISIEERDAHRDSRRQQ